MSEGVVLFAVPDFDASNPAGFSDVVEQLGHFVELEVILDSEETLEKGVSEARDLMQQLGIRESALIEGAYVDLLHRTPRQ